jgi:hypothetical protein
MKNCYISPLFFTTSLVETGSKTGTDTGGFAHLTGIPGTGCKNAGVPVFLTRVSCYQNA